LTLAQFLLPGEGVVYESRREVYYGRTPYRLYVTGGRLLLHAVTGRFVSKERVAAEPLADIRHMEYSEGGLLSRRGRPDVRLTGDTLSLTGEPETIREVWRALQRVTLQPVGGAAGEEVTLVAPPPPLFDNPSHPPARVEPLPTATPLRKQPGVTSRHAALFVVVASFVAAAAVTAVLLSRNRARTAPPQEARSTITSPTPAPTPVPTPVSVHVMDETFTVDEGSHRAVKFTVPAETRNARVSGGFRVTSGSYVDFYLMSEGQYDRFARGGPADVTSIVYREEQWNVRIGERLPPGNYYLVFDNYDSEGGPQTVAAEFFVVLV